MRKSFFVFFMIATLICNSVTAHASALNSQKDEELILTADSAILMDAKTGQVLYEKNMHKKQFPASITKLMTVLIALEYSNLEELVTFSKEAVFGIERNSSHIAIDVGEQLSLKQSLYAIILASANEVSLGVAEHIGGSKEAFSKQMTKRAEELGCLDTNFVNPNGLHNENHFTSAYDMALITKEVLKFDQFREIAATTYYEISPTNKQPESRYLYAQHKMIKKNSSFFYEGCEGGKTGFTNEAQNTLVSFAKRGETELIAVVLKDAGTGIYTDTTALFDYGFGNYQTIKAFSSNGYQKEVAIKQNSDKNETNSKKILLHAENDIYATIPLTASKKDLTQEVVCEEILTPPIAYGSPQGELSIYYNNQKIGSTQLLASSAVNGYTQEQLNEMKKSSFFGFLKPALYIGIGAMIAFLAIYFLASYAYHEKQKRRRRKRFRSKYRSRE